MPKLSFLGTVQPPSVKIGIPTTHYNLNLSDGQTTDVDLILQTSKFTVQFTLESYSPKLHNELFIRANDLCRMCLNLVSFATGQGLISIIETFVDPQGQRRTITYLESALAGKCTTFRFPFTTDQQRMDFEEIMRLIGQDEALWGAMNDLATNLVAFHQTPIVCGRVLDSLRRSVAPDLERPKGWPVLHSAVNVDRSFAEWVSSYSTGPRHGDWSKIPDAVLGEMLSRTWLIVNRFLEYRKRNSNPLPLSEFPMLTSTNEPK